MSKFTTRVIKGGSLLDDSRRFVEIWDVDLGVEDNLDRFRGANLLQKPSRSRSEDAVAILRQRFVDPGPGTMEALKVLVKQERPFVDACLFEAARNDDLLALAAGDVLFGWRARRDFLVTPELLESELARGPAGKDVTSWSVSTLRRVVHGLLATLRDFDLLEGKAVKRIARPRLSLPGSAYVLGRLLQTELAASKVVNSKAWRWWFLDERDVRAVMLEADREGLIRYSEAGSAVRIDWRPDSLKEAVLVAA